MKSVILLGLAAMALLFGCVNMTNNEQQYLCSDGSTIVSDLTSCPKVDLELKECQDASTASDYYGESDRDICYYDLALTRNNITYCKMIHNSDYYSDYTSARCGVELALYNDNMALCNNLSVLSRYDCFADLATDLDDPSICQNIKSVPKMDDCLYDYVYSNSYYISDWSVCGMFSGKGDDSDYCYYEAASDTGDLSYCDELTGDDYYYGYSKTSCYASVAKNKKSPSICDKLSTTEEKDDCYYDYATGYPYVVDVCNNISEEYRKDDCIDWANYSYY